MGIPTVVIAWREPSLFVAACEGVDELRAHGVRVVELSDLVAATRSLNRHSDLN